MKRCPAEYGTAKFPQSCSNVSLEFDSTKSAPSCSLPLIVKPRSLCLAYSLLLAFASPAFSVALRADEPDPDRRITAAFVLAFGRAPTASEISAVSKNTAGSISDLVARLGQELENDQGQKNMIALRAFVDVFGREPLPGEINPAEESDATYLAATRRHLRRLVQHREE